jgi:hypothetical protein
MCQFGTASKPPFLNSLRKKNTETAEKVCTIAEKQELSPESLTAAQLLFSILHSLRWAMKRRNCRFGEAGNLDPIKNASALLCLIYKAHQSGI